MSQAEITGGVKMTHMETDQEYQERIILINTILDNNSYDFHQDYLDAKNRLAQMRVPQLNRIRRLQLIEQGEMIWTCKR